MVVTHQCSHSNDLILPKPHPKPNQALHPPNENNNPSPEGLFSQQLGAIVSKLNRLDADLFKLKKQKQHSFSFGHPSEAKLQWQDVFVFYKGNSGSCVANSNYNSKKKKKNREIFRGSNYHQLLVKLGQLPLHKF